MDAPVTAKTALLQVLLEGRSYGSELAERISERTKGRLTLSQGSLYPALKKFEEEGLVTSYNEEGEKKADNHTGRPRIYYKLTSAGVKAASAEREILQALIGRKLDLEKVMEAARVKRFKPGKKTAEISKRMAKRAKRRVASERVVTKKRAQKKRAVSVETSVASPAPVALENAASVAVTEPAPVTPDDYSSSTPST